MLVYSLLPTTKPSCLLESNKAMFNVCIILLHRPSVSEGYLHLKSTFIASGAFSKCSAAAFEIDQIPKTYEKSFCFKSAIMSHTTYVSATIHTRLAALREWGSEAHMALC